VNLAGLLTALGEGTGQGTAFTAVGDLAATGSGATVESPAALHPLVVAEIALRRPTGTPVIVVTATGREAEDVAAAIPELVPGAQVAVFPS